MLFIIIDVIGVSKALAHGHRSLWSAGGHTDPPSRGEHSLVLFSSGVDRCVHCSSCASQCCANAITYVLSMTGLLARLVSMFLICCLRCIFCGYCDVVCPTSSVVHSSVSTLLHFNACDLQLSADHLHASNILILAC